MFINKHCNKKILNISFNNNSTSNVTVEFKVKRILNNETSFEKSYEGIILNDYFYFKGMFNKEKFTKILYNSRFYIAKIKNV